MIMINCPPFSVISTDVDHGYSGKLIMKTRVDHENAAAVDHASDLQKRRNDHETVMIMENALLIFIQDR